MPKLQFSPRALPRLCRRLAALLLCGTIDLSALPVAVESGDFVAARELASLKAQQASMQRELLELRALVERLYDELGVVRGE